MEQINSNLILKEFYECDIQRYKEGKIPRTLEDLAKIYPFHREALSSLLVTRLELAHFFKDQLRYIIKKIKKDFGSAHTHYQEVVEQNLKEELGKLPEYGGPHEKDREIFLTALGVDYATWVNRLGTYRRPEKICQATKFILDAVKPLINLGGMSGLIVLWYWEHRLSRGGYGEFCILLKACEKLFSEFKKNVYQPGDVLYWLASHAEHDTHHAKAVADVLDNNAMMDRDVTRSILNTMDSYFEVYWSLLGVYHGTGR